MFCVPFFFGQRYLALRMTSALSRPFDRSQVGMFSKNITLFVNRCFGSWHVHRLRHWNRMMPIRNDTPNCIPCLRCILGSNVTCFTRLLRLLSFESKRLSLRMHQGGALAPLFPPPSCPHHTLGKRLLDLAQHTVWQDHQDAPVSFLRS